MHTVDLSLLFHVVNFACADIAVKLGVGKAEVVLVGLAAKPVDRHLVNKHVRQPEQPADLLTANLDLKKTAAAVLVMHNGSMTKVPLENVLYFEAFEKRVFAALKSGKYEIKQRICELEDMLNGRKFIRISRSVLVNMNKVVGYKTGFDRTLLAVLSDKEELRVSRTHSDNFKKNLEEV